MCAAKRSSISGTIREGMLSIGLFSGLGRLIGLVLKILKTLIYPLQAQILVQECIYFTMEMVVQLQQALHTSSTMETMYMIWHKKGFFYWYDLYKYVYVET